MHWTRLHATVLTRAFEKVLGKPESGSMAFARCLDPEAMRVLAGDVSFAPEGWDVRCVADADDESMRTVTADRAVEIRETKENATVVLVDTERAGAGMDGIYSAAREVDEADLFKEAKRLAGREVTRRLSSDHRNYADRAINARRRFNISPWTELDFLCRIAADGCHPGSYLHLLGLWPVRESENSEKVDELKVSRMFVDRLLGTAVSGLAPARLIETLRLSDPSREQRDDLEQFVRWAAAEPLLPALAKLADKKHLWVNALCIERAAKFVQEIELSSWQNRNGTIAKWSGLVESDNPEAPPTLLLDPEAEGDYSRLEVKWKARPAKLEKGCAEYRIAIMTGHDEELASSQVTHSARKEEKVRFDNDDFAVLSEDALIESAKVVVSVIGDDSVESQESEAFTIRFGQAPGREQSGVGKKVRTFSEGLIELDDRETVSDIVSSAGSLPLTGGGVSVSVDSKGFLLLRTLQHRKSFKLFRPSLIDEAERQWIERAGEIGRWRVKVRVSGMRDGKVEFVPLAGPGPVSAESSKSPWVRATDASRRMAEKFAVLGGGVGQVYDEKSRTFGVAKEYLLAWAVLLEGGDPHLALANTVEVQSLSGRTIGLIVLPSHPLRVAWSAAYDNLVLHAAFNEERTVNDVRREFSGLDGAMFPALLPGLVRGTSFVFADTLGFHATGMVSDSDREPKAAMAILARALGEGEIADAAPTVGEQSASVLGNEIAKYLDCHETFRLLHVHALRAGDGSTMARSLGRVLNRYDSDPSGEDTDGDAPSMAPTFVLELYPSKQQRGIAGRFISEAREKRRRGAGVLSDRDRWMLESRSLSGGVTLPKLRWARKEEEYPETAAHLAVAFDTFESRVTAEDDLRSSRSRPLHAFGLLSFFDREYTSLPAPSWRSMIPASNEGEKHPSDRTHTERLMRLQNAIQGLVSRNIGAGENLPALKTEISRDKAQSLWDLHRLCDWVITLDRNAGIEYFDSPRDNPDIYDAYVIDCVPEREDLGCLQLITSTGSLEEVRNLLDDALARMGLSRSRRNAEFLLKHLKALSGRLAIRLTGQRAPSAELVALAVSHTNCLRASDSDECWASLENGFLIPVDDIRDLLPPLGAVADDETESRTRPDLIHVSMVARGALRFRFIEVKYRRHLRAARAPVVLKGICDQVESLHERWTAWYGGKDVSRSFRVVRRAKLARVLRFYADKARRHHLPKERHKAIVSEVNRMIENGGDYAFAETPKGDRGWIFCPEYAGAQPLEVSPQGGNTRIFLFGPGLLPDSDYSREPVEQPPLPSENLQADIAQLKPLEELGSDKASSPVEQRATVVPDTSGENGDDSGDNVGSPEGEAPAVCFGSDTLTGADVRLQLTTKGNPHLLIAGLPGMGKTTCLLNLCGQMVSSGVRPIVFSYHQDIDEGLEGMVESVRFIDFDGLGFNPLQVLQRNNRLAHLDVAGSLRDIFAAIYPELGDIQGERIRKSVKDSFIEAGWDDTNASFEDLEEPRFKRFVEILRDDPKPDQGLRALLMRLGELEDYGFFDLRETRESLWESERPIVIRIHKTQNENLQRAFASLIFYGLYKDMFRRGIQDRVTHALIFDEAHRASKLKLIPTMAKECRKYGVSLVLASQEAKDFNISLYSAIANYLVLRLTESDAKALVRNVASSQQERALIDKVKQMERFKALYFREGKTRPFSVDLLP